MMKLIIDIPDCLYDTIKLDDHGVHQGRIYDIIRDGMPLPKGHGPLIDVNELEPDTEWSYYEDDYISYSRNQINSATVIVEAYDIEPQESEE